MCTGVDTNLFSKFLLSEQFFLALLARADERHAGLRGAALGRLRRRAPLTVRRRMTHVLLVAVVTRRLVIDVVTEAAATGLVDGGSRRRRRCLSALPLKKNKSKWH